MVRGVPYKLRYWLRRDWLVRRALGRHLLRSSVGVKVPSPINVNKGIPNKLGLRSRGHSRGRVFPIDNAEDILAAPVGQSGNVRCEGLFTDSWGSKAVQVTEREHRGQTTAEEFTIC